MGQRVQPAGLVAEPPSRTVRQRAARPGPAWPGLAAVLALLAVWQTASLAGWVPADLLPGPGAVAAAFWQVGREGYRGTTLAGNAGATVGRCLAGFGLAALAGVPLGLLMGTSRKVSGFCNWAVQFLRPLPPLSYMVLLILWFGTGNLSKVVLLFLTAFPIVASAAMAGVRGVPAVRVQAAQMLGATRGQVFRHVVFPAALPMIFTGLRIALAAAFSTVVAAEFLAAQDGLGWMVLSAGKFLQNATVVMGIVLLGLIGMALSRALQALDARLIHWRRAG